MPRPTDDCYTIDELGAHESGLENLQRAVARGYYAAPTLERSRHFDALRSHPAFRAVLAQAEAGRDRALKAFREAGGERLLGRTVVQSGPEGAARKPV